MEFTVETGYGYVITTEPTTGVYEQWRFYRDLYRGDVPRLRLAVYVRVEGECAPGHPTCRHWYFRKGAWDDDEEHVEGEQPPLPEDVAETVRKFAIEHISRGIRESPITVGGY